MATAAGDSVALTGDDFIDGLTQGGSWTFAGPQTLTYSFSFNTEPEEPVWADYAALAQAFTQATSAWASVANITFVQADSGSVITQSAADIAVALEDEGLFVALGVFPDPE